mgnify:CR=1 FL=1
MAHALSEGGLEGRSAIVTGAAGGIGAAIVQRLLSDGASVTAVDLDTGSLSEAFGEAVDQGRLMPFPCDLSVSDRREAIVPAALERFGSVDVLINNAARIVRTDIRETSEAEWDALVAVNLKAAFFLSQRAAQGMHRRGWGRIVNLSSQAGHTGGAVDCPIYALTKGGINTMTRSFARAFAASGVTVNAVAPGIVMTDMIAKTMSTDRVSEITEQIPIGRVTEAAEIAAAVAYLCSDDAASITGHVLDINGGMLMR